MGSRTIGWGQGESNGVKANGVQVKETGVGSMGNVARNAYMLYHEVQQMQQAIIVN